jgi:hypothetical protein
MERLEIKIVMMWGVTRHGLLVERATVPRSLPEGSMRRWADHPVRNVENISVVWTVRS